MSPWTFWTRELIYNTLKRAQCYNTKTNIMHKQPWCYAWYYSVFQGNCCVWLPGDVLRADVNPLFMSIPGEGIHFYLRLKLVLWVRRGNCLVAPGWINSCEATHTKDTLSAVSPFRAPVGPDPIQIWCSCFDVYEPIALKMQDNDSGVRETVIYTNVVNTSSF